MTGDDEREAAPALDDGPGGAPVRSARARWFAVAGCGALVVATVFATVGDGVDLPEATGVRAWLVDNAHVVTWVLLSGAFFSASGRRGWTATSQALAVGAGVGYLAFLAAVFVL